jgi:hypothetical protein
VAQYPRGHERCDHVAIPVAEDNSAGVDAAALFVTAAAVSIGAGGVMWVMALTVSDDPEHPGRFERVSSKRRLAD